MKFEKKKEQANAAATKLKAGRIANPLQDLVPPMLRNPIPVSGDV